MNTRAVVVVIVIIAVIVATSLYFETASRGLTASTLPQSIAIQSGMNVAISSDNLTVGVQSGLWQMELRNAGTVSVSNIVVYLQTPTESKVCSGADSSSGLFFSNCTVAPSGNPLPPGAAVSGYATGIGEGSATVGSNYPVAAKVTFDNGDVVWVNSTVLAMGAPG